MIRIAKKWIYDGELDALDGIRLIGAAVDTINGLYSTKSKKRRNFSEAVKKEILHIQKNKCAMCRKKLESPQYDHIDGDRSNNAITNCQALCPNCHVKKSMDKKKR